LRLPAWRCRWVAASSGPAGILVAGPRTLLGNIGVTVLQPPWSPIPPEANLRSWGKKRNAEGLRPSARPDTWRGQRGKAGLRDTPKPSAETCLCTPHVQFLRKREPGKRWSVERYRYAGNRAGPAELGDAARHGGPGRDPASGLAGILAAGPVGPVRNNGVVVTTPGCHHPTPSAPDGHS